jgi:hypothetical protein
VYDVYGEYSQAYNNVALSVFFKKLNPENRALFSRKTPVELSGYRSRAFKTPTFQLQRQHEEIKFPSPLVNMVGKIPEKRHSIKIRKTASIIIAL